MLVVVVFGCIVKMLNIFATGQAFVMVSVILVALIDNGMIILAGPGLV